MSWLKLGKLPVPGQVNYVLWNRHLELELYSGKIPAFFTLHFVINILFILYSTVCNRVSNYAKTMDGMSE
jgi:hypothetical protein